MSEETQAAEALFGRYDLESEAAERPANGSQSALSSAPALNKQLYENSPLCGSPIEQDYLNSPDALFNDRTPNLRVEHEKPEHRIVLFLKGQGLSNREIARKTGYTEPWISQVLRQPWARARLVRELQEAGQDAVQEAIRSAALDSVFTLIDQRDNEKAKPADRINAADKLLDRFLGKPMQHVEAKTTTIQSSIEVEALQKELASLEAEQKRLTGN